MTSELRLVLSRHLVAASLLLIGGPVLPSFADDSPASAPTPAVAPVPAATDPAKPADPEDEIICKREEMTGTRVSRYKICGTRREWRTRSTDDGEYIRDRQRKSNTSQPGNRDK